MWKYFCLFLYCFILISVFNNCHRKSKPDRTNITDSIHVQIPDSLSVVTKHIETRKPLIYENRVYRNNIKTVQLYKYAYETSAPVIGLNSTDKLLLCFDDLQEDIKEYSYTVIHCNADWIPSVLNPSDYIEGFEENYIIDYKHSFNTTVGYNHYSLLFPNDNLKLIKSGNYLLAVYTDSLNYPVITRRFMVVEQKVRAEIFIKRPRQLEQRNSHQEVDFTVNHQQLEVNNPFEEIKVVLMQNFRWDNAVYDLKPVFIKNNELTYDYGEQNMFIAGKEFREFDIRSLRFYSERVKNIKTDISKIEVFLVNDEVRSYQRYLSRQDINGKFYVDVYEGNVKKIEADYAFVHFSLLLGFPLHNGSLYVTGKFCDWETTEANKMHYNPEEQSYEAAILLKQGIYNYAYAFVKDNSYKIDLTLVDGSYYETENDYQLLIYYRRFGNNYDEMVGIKTVNTFNNIR